LKQAGSLRDSSTVISENNKEWAANYEHKSSKNAKIKSSQIEQMEHILRDPETEKLTETGLQLKV
jgi:hypothetical protein